MSDLGKATIKIDVLVSNLGRAKSQLDSVFNKLEKRIDDIDFGFDALDRRLISLGNNRGFMKMLRAITLATKGFRGMKHQVDMLDRGLAKVNMPKTFNSELAKSEKFTKDLVRQLDRVNRELKQIKANKPALGSGGGAMPRPAVSSNLARASQLNTAGSAVGGAGRSMMIGATIAAAAMALIGKEGAQFEQELINVASVINGLTDGSVKAGKEIQKLSDKFQELGRTTEYSATEIAAASRQLALSGFSSDEIIESISAISSLASATNTELEKTAQITARIKNAFSLSAMASEGLADTLASVAANSNTTLEGLGESFKLASPIAAAYGQSVEDVAVAFGILGDAGIQNSRAGTGISRLLSELTEKRGDINELLAPFGQTADSLDPMSNSLKEILGTFEDLVDTGKITKGDLFDLLDQRSARTLVSLINSGTEAYERLENQRSAGIASQIRDFRVDETIAGQFKILQSAVSALAIEITQALTPAIMTVITSFTGITNKITKFISENKGATVLIGGLAAAFTGLAGSAGMLLVGGGVFLKLGAALAYMSEGVAMIGLKLGLNGGFGGILIRLIPKLLKFAGIIGIIIAGVLGWVKAFKALNEMTGIFSKIGSIISGIGSAFSAFMGYDGDIESIGMSAGATAVQFDLLSEGVKKAKQQVQDLISQGDNLAKFGDLTANAVKKMFDGDLSKDIFDISGGRQEALGNTIGSDSAKALGDQRDKLRERVKQLQSEQGYIPFVNFRKDQDSIDAMLEQIDKIEDKLRGSKDELETYAQTVAKVAKESVGVFKQGGANILDIQLRAELDLTGVNADIKALDKKRREGGEDSIQYAEDLKALQEQKAELEKLVTLQKKQTSAMSAAQIEIAAEYNTIRESGASQIEQDKARAVLAQRLIDTKKEEARLAEEAKSVKEDMVKLDEAVHTFQRDTLTGSEKLLINLNERASKAAEMYDKALKSSTALRAINDNEIENLKDQLRLRKEALKTVGREGTDEAAEAKTLKLNKEIENIKQNIGNIQARNADISEQDNANLENSFKIEETRLAKIEEINAKSLAAQKAMLAKAEEVTAKEEGNYVKQVQLLKEKLDLERESQLKKFDEQHQFDKNNQKREEAAEITQMRVDLENALLKTQERQLSNLVNLKEGNQDLLDIYRGIEESFLSQDEISKNSIDRDAAARAKKIDDEVELLRLKTKGAEENVKDLTGQDRIDAQAEIDEANALIKRADDMKAKNEKARQKSQQKREKKNRDAIDSDLLDARIETAKREGAIDEEVRLTRQKREQEYLNNISELTGLSAKERSELILNEEEKLDADLKKLKEDRLKEQEDKAKKEAKSAAKISNTVAKERDEIEDGVLKKLIDQVKTLQQAKALMMFMAKIEQAKKAKARREGLAQLSASRRLGSLKSQRSDIVAEGGSTRAIDNKIARAELDLNLATASASSSFNAVGASAAQLSTTLSTLNARLNSGKGAVTAKGAGNNTSSAGTPAGGAPKPSGAGNAVTVNIDMNGVIGSEEQFADRVKQAALEGIQEALV